MLDPEVNQKRESAAMSGFARFGGLDRLDWLMILASVLLGTIAKQHHFLDLPDWLLEWVSPFLLMAFGYKVRRKITEVVASRRDRAKDTRDE
ncbi:MAG TPA: hypothetical protein VNH18_14160 [Bryobacteraceae bacterium]|jgi:hypothetical protein|nr:hypothetical protein [Bryobacteraceae bacterium]HXJ40421.1 hypothetical protein [Bryobacteraceae bacterium]